MNCTTPLTPAVCQLTIPPATKAAERVYALMLALAEQGGTDYTADPTTVFVDACPFLSLDEGQREAVRVDQLFQLAEALGATVPATIDDKIAAVKCLKEYALSDLEAFEDFLKCQLFGLVT